MDSGSKRKRFTDYSTPRAAKRQLNYGHIFQKASEEKCFRENTPSKISTSSADVAVATVVTKWGVDVTLKALDYMRHMPYCSPASLLRASLPELPEDVFEWIMSVSSHETFRHLWLADQSRDCLVLVPPTYDCLHCPDSKLEAHNKCVDVKVLSCQGLKSLKKQSFRCRSCSRTYNYSQYGMKKTGLTFYKEERPLVEGNDAFFMERETYRHFVSLMNHAFVSFETYTESINDAFDHGVVGRPGRLDRRQISSCFYRGEVENELRTRTLIESTFFPDDAAYETVMDKLEELRKTELYRHDGCNELCYKKGCGRLWVADGIWKLVFPHCMFIQKNVVEGVVLANLPEVCTESLVHGYAFCQKHCTFLNSHKIPTKLKEFLRYCGISGVESDGDTVSLNVYDEEKIRNALIGLRHDHDYGHASSLENSDGYSTAIPTSQLNDIDDGFVNVLKKCSAPQSDVVCNHATSDNKKMRKFSRGHLFFVRAGGHIDSWTPLYQSEGVGQVFIQIILWLYKVLKDVPKEDWQKYWLAYDNMCNVTKMHAAKEKLNLDPPYDDMFREINKCVDGLHIKNHVDPTCLKTLHPDRIYEMYPDLRGGRNTMAAEQTFVWAGRFKKMVCSMSKRHHLFFLHRMVIYRNRYTEKCYENNRHPVLPGVKIG